LCRVRREVAVCLEAGMAQKQQFLSPTGSIKGLSENEKGERIKKSIILYQSKESKGIKKIDGSYGYFQDPNLIYYPPCCFLKIEDDDNRLNSGDNKNPTQDTSNIFTQRSFWILETCIECRYSIGTQKKFQKKSYLGFGYLMELFYGCTVNTIHERGKEVIQLLYARSMQENSTKALALPVEYPMSAGGTGYLIRQLSRKIKSREFWDIQFLESAQEPFLLELHIKAFGSQQYLTPLTPYL
jgi:hypothetical protein